MILVSLGRLEDALDHIDYAIVIAKLKGLVDRDTEEEIHLQTCILKHIKERDEGHEHAEDEDEH